GYCSSAAAERGSALRRASSSSRHRNRPSTGQWWMRKHVVCLRSEYPHHDRFAMGERERRARARRPRRRRQDGHRGLAARMAPGYVVYSSTGTAAGLQWGSLGDIPVPGDFDKDGNTDLAVFRPSSGIWYIWYSSTETRAGF